MMVDYETEIVIRPERIPRGYTFYQAPLIVTRGPSQDSSGALRLRAPGMDWVFTLPDVSVPGHLWPMQHRVVRLPHDQTHVMPHPQAGHVLCGTPVHTDFYVEVWWIPRETHLSDAPYHIDGMGVVLLYHKR